MFYTQFTNSHITNNLKSVPVDKLKIGEHIILLGGDENVFTNNYKLSEIKNDKIYIFNSIDGKIPADFQLDSSFYTTNYNYNKLYTYNGDNSLVYLFESDNCRNDYCSDDLLEQLGYSVYNDCKEKGVISNTYVSTYTAKGEKVNKIFNYLIVPLDDKAFMCLLKEFTHKTYTNDENTHENTYVDDYVLFGEYMDEIEISNNFLNKLGDEYKIRFFNNKLRQHWGNVTKIFEKIKTHLNYDTTEFEENLFALNYNLNRHLRDLNRETNIEKVQNTFNKLGISFDIKTKYSPVFTHKSGIKSYYFNNDCSVTFNDLLTSWNSQIYKGETLYIKDGTNVSIKAPIEVKNNKNSTMFEIALKVAEFEKEKKSGIDPRTGDFYEKGKINNEKIVYSDCKGLIISERSYRSYYVKKYGYYIRTNKTKEIKEIEERCEVISKLTE